VIWTQSDKKALASEPGSVHCLNGALIFAASTPRPWAASSNQPTAASALPSLSVNRRRFARPRVVPLRLGARTR